MVTRALTDTNPSILPQDRTVPRNRTAAGWCTLLLGLALVFFVGFAPLSAVHNAAHDSRHAAAFPCH